MKTFYADKNNKLSSFLLKAYDGKLSYANFMKLLRKRDIKINGTRVAKDVNLCCGDQILVYYDGDTAKSNYQILFDDDNILVAVKPKGITSEKFYSDLSENSNLFFCHRLDRNTDGIMLFAHNEASYQEILSAFKNRTFTKIYTAEVYGVTKQEETIEGFLFKDSKNAKVTIYNKFVKGSVPIKTKYKLIETDGVKSKIEVTLITGRTHQIRAHLAYIGHFVLGDGKYGDEAINRKLGIKKLLLSATKLTLHFSDQQKLSYLDGKTFILP